LRHRLGHLLKRSRCRLSMRERLLMHEHMLVCMVGHGSMVVDMVHMVVGMGLNRGSMVVGMGHMVGHGSMVDGHMGHGHRRELRHMHWRGHMHWHGRMHERLLNHIHR